MSIIIKLKDEEFFSFESFAKNIYRYYDEAFLLINKEKFLNLLKAENEELFNKVLYLRKEELEDDVFVFKVQYLLSPFMELRFRTYKFQSLKSLGKMILNGNPKIDVYISDLIKNKLISYYMRVQGLNKLEANLYESVLKVENEYLENPNRAYFKMGFVLAETRKIVYRRRWYDDVSSFFQEILKPTEINDFCETFEKSQYVFAWLELLGLEDKIDLYQSVIATTKELEEK